MSTAAVRRHWARVAALGCWNDGRPAQIAHAHSGSIVERMQEPKAKGRKLPRYDWLVIPLCPECHAELDANVKAWEEKYWSQALIIDRQCQRFGVNLWQKANDGRK